MLRRMAYNCADMALDNAVYCNGGKEKIYLVFRLLLDKGRDKSSDTSDHSSDECARQTLSEKDATRVVAVDREV